MGKVVDTNTREREKYVRRPIGFPMSGKLVPIHRLSLGLSALDSARSFQVAVEERPLIQSFPPSVGRDMHRKVRADSRRPSSQEIRRPWLSNFEFW